jgi:hypothetical protein
MIDGVPFICHPDYHLPTPDDIPPILRLDKQLAATIHDTMEEEKIAKMS